MFKHKFSILQTIQIQNTRAMTAPLCALASECAAVQESVRLAHFEALDAVAAAGAAKGAAKDAPEGAASCCRVCARRRGADQAAADAQLGRPAL